MDNGFNFGDDDLDFGGDDLGFTGGGQSSNSQNDDFDWGGSSSSSASSFDSDGGFGSNGASSSGGNSIPDDAFTGAFDGAADQSQQAGATFQDDQSAADTKKKALIFAGVGIVLVITVIGVATLINSKLNKSSGTSTTQSATTTTANSNINVDNMMSTGNTQQVVQPPTAPQQSSTVVVGDTFNWTEIEDDAQIAYNNSYSELTFTITGIKHYARSVDVNNNLVIKTTLTGSISGLSGTYSLDVPYNKGTKLVVGNQFTVQVLLGQYNGKTVVCDIVY